jgi:uncharacterized protein (DUF849 family)
MAASITGCPPPLYRFMFSDSFSFGFAPEPYALDAYLQLLGREAPDSPWMIGGLGVDIRPLIADAVGRGGHIRVGLEDAPLGTQRTNVQWVEDAVAILASVGERPASATDIRQAFKA